MSPRLLSPRVALGLALCLVLVAPARSASSAPPAELVKLCESSLEPAVFEVRTEPSRVLYDFSKSTAELTAMKQPASKGLFTLGLTVTNVSLRGSWNWSAMTTKKGTSCLRPDMRVLVTVNPQTVYVAREFPQGTCAFNDIVSHELRHVQTNQAHMERVAQHFQERINNYYGQRIFYGDIDTMRKQVREAFEDHWQVAIQNELLAVETLHARIDTPQEYARNDVMCDGIVPRTLRALR